MVGGDGQERHLKKRRNSAVSKPVICTIMYHQNGPASNRRGSRDVLLALIPFLRRRDAPFLVEMAPPIRPVVEFNATLDLEITLVNREG